MVRWILTVLVLWLPGSLTAQDNWPQFRGPDASGLAENPNLPTRWSQTENVAWKTPIPGRGWSSPIVWGNRVIVTTVTKDGKYPEAKKGLYFGGEQFRAPPEEHRWLVVCLDLDTGKVVWQREAAKGIPKKAIHIKNSYASETPVTDGERIYAYFGNQGLYCYNFDGKLLWSKPFPAVRTRFSWGTAASPVLHEDRLWIVSDNDEESYLLCLDKYTGKEVWKKPRDEKSNWATPFIWQNAQRTEIVTNGTGKVRSYDLDGNVLWELGGMSSITVPTPVAYDGLLYIGSGYVLDRKRPIFAIKPGASGDISLAKGQTKNDYVVWHQPQAGPYNPSFLLVDDLVYCLYDRGQLSCYDAKTGALIYDRERLRGQYTVSPWSYGDKLFCLNEDGLTTVVAVAKEFRVLGQNDLDEQCMATPAIAGDRLLIRTLSQLYCIASLQ